MKNHLHTLIERIHERLGQSLNKTVEKWRVADGVYHDTETSLAYDDGSQTSQYYPEVSASDNAWPSQIDRTPHPTSRHLQP